MNAPVDLLFDMRDAAMKLGEAKQQPAALRLLDAHDAVAHLLDWSEQALECMSASKYPNSYAELRAAIARFKGGAA